MTDTERSALETDLAAEIVRVATPSMADELAAALAPWVRERLQATAVRCYEEGYDDALADMGHCHCGEPVVVHDWGSRWLCKTCDTERCDAPEPGAKYSCD